MDYVATGFAKELVDLTTRLRELLEAETSAITSKNVKQIFPLQPKKQTLGREYETFCLQIQADPNLLKGWDASLREQFSQETKRLNAVLYENEQALRAVKEVNQLVVETIVRTLASSKKTVNLYNRQGHSHNIKDGLGKKAVSIKLDERL